MQELQELAGGVGFEFVWEYYWDQVGWKERDVMTIFGTRHYEAIAEEFKKCRESYGFDHIEVEAVARSFADMFRQDNERFDSELFFKVCGMEE